MVPSVLCPLSVLHRFELNVILARVRRLDLVFRKRTTFYLVNPGSRKYRHHQFTGVEKWGMIRDLIDLPITPCIPVISIPS